MQAETKPVRGQLLKTEIGMPLVYDTGARPGQHLTVPFSPERSRIPMDISAADVNKLKASGIFTISRCKV